MKIRDATEDDLELLVEGLLDVRMIEKRPEKDIPVTGEDVESFRKGIREGAIRVMEDGNGGSVAFIYYRTDMRIPYVSGEYLWIDIIYVREDERGKGYGSALYEEAIEYAKRSGIDRIVIDIFDVNQRSKEFHSKMEFAPSYTIYIKEL